jgi:hypothetical protein
MGVHRPVTAGCKAKAFPRIIQSSVAQERFSMKLRSVLTVLGVVAAAPAFAGDPVSVTLSGFKYNSSVKTATISVNGTSIGPVYAGEYSGKINGNDFSTFCTDVYQSLSFGPTYQYEPKTVDETKALWGPNTTYNPNSYSLVSKLFTTAYSSVNNSTTSAAFQYALWELLYEKKEPYSIGGTGNFQLTNTDAAATSQANTWLAAVTGANASEGYIVQSLFNGDFNPLRTGAQDLVIATPVPEPQTYALALVSLGIVAGYARRKRDKA